MQLFSDTSFFIVAGVLSIPAIIMGLRQIRISCYGFAVTLIFLWLAMGHNIRALLWLAGFSFGEYAVIRIYLMLHQKYGRNKHIYHLFLALSILPVAANKVLTAVGNPYHMFAFLGISYMSFKVIQIVIEIYDNVIHEVRPFEYLYLLWFFPTVMSGPIDRSRRFSADLEHVPSRSEYIEMLGSGLSRILQGLVYKKVIGTGFYQLMMWFGMKSGFTSAMIYMYCYGFYLFFDFAGYSSMAIGVSKIFGINTPENFNKPFISKDIKEFWDRWHITLSHWFRDFIFSRVTMGLIRKRFTRNKLVIATIAFIINMGIMGCWHGLTIYYILYGLYHGILLSLTEIYQKKSKFYKKHKKDRWFCLLEWFITFHLVMFGFFLFSGRFTQLVLG
ncbi:MAG: D-alanyl-lipoteichoic acid biosynthesis protein DltB [Eubacterium sp.]|jgi:membrane protein involved in D-alanine export|nr:D-alanyl-lipoteichoic acid biosynthesis protein DltB [Eubacterium sp.]MCH4046593.1 D-alanyl-lipoteichoic acid biosynthesis protein DltB [Eubacterium sp.]MCH4079689.1 D-alanyl-lipoteichoic acid biosynthesis protein DltB [Eubacterium sp.]MCH4110249.1 D-alanyl-lipoteichoic acid biosynthesis protein DltB [Eubacterium sp.]MCI1307851.1 D-alanyl-lipoteichoic acid biosynthesis protein DltB [Eubacterium sp.]